MKTSTLTVIRRRDSRKQRSGVILMIVLVVIAALSVACYGFSHLMLTELSVVKASNRSNQQQLVAESAVSRLLSSNPRQLSKLSFPAEHSFSKTTGSTRARLASGKLSLSSSQTFTGQYAVLKGIPQPNKPMQFGLNNESSKLNLNSLTLDRFSREQVIAKLMCYEELREATAAGIADLLGVFDIDINTRRKPEPSRTLGGQLKSFDQLLEVSGVTEQLLYGEDRNRNGVLDPCEDDGNRSFPPDNQDGRLNTGWTAHWTLTGSESNIRSDDSNDIKLKVNLNQSDLVTLYDQLIDFCTAEEARFIVAWRLTSPTYTDITSDSDRPTAAEITRNRKRNIQERIARQLGLTNDPNSSVNARPNNNRDTIRAGLDLGARGGRKFKSLLDLASCQLQILIDGEDTVLSSPFANDPASLRRWLPLWESRTTVSEGPVHVGRINILQATRQTLETVEGITPQLAQQIVSQRNSFRSDRRQNEGQEQTIGWLIEAGIFSTAGLRRIAHEITMGGTVFKGFVLGQLDNSRTANAIYIELESSGSIPVLRRSFDIEPLTYRQRLPNN